MSKESIFNLTGLQEPVLISEAHVGLPGDTVVYQYGFGQPQGPVSAGKYAIGIFQRFAEFFKKQFNVLPRKVSFKCQRLVTDSNNCVFILEI